MATFSGGGYFDNSEFITKLHMKLCPINNYY